MIDHQKKTVLQVPHKLDTRLEKKTDKRLKSKLVVKLFLIYFLLIFFLSTPKTGVSVKSNVKLHVFILDLTFTQ